MSRTMSVTRLIGLATLLAGTPLAAQSAWTKAPALPRACYRTQDTFEADVEKAKTSLQAGLETQEQTNKRLLDQVFNMDPATLNQRMMAVIQKDPAKAPEIMQAMQSLGTPAGQGAVRAAETEGGGVYRGRGGKKAPPLPVPMDGRTRSIDSRRGGSSDPPDRLRAYNDATLADADLTASFIAGSYAGFRRFPAFASYSMFYFAAASFSEMARRLTSPRTPRGFLCGDSPAFTSALERLSPAVRTAADVERYEDEVATAVADRNIAGLCDRGKQNWYVVDLEDTIRSASKLGLTSDQVKQALHLELGTCEP